MELGLLEYEDAVLRDQQSLHNNRQQLANTDAHMSRIEILAGDFVSDGKPVAKTSKLFDLGSGVDPKKSDPAVHSTAKRLRQ